MIAASPVEPPALSVRRISKRFGGLAAVDDLTFEVPRNAIFGVMGPNGAGKTTVLNLVTGLYRADGGTVAVGGSPVTGLTPYRVARHGVARTYQNVRLFDGLTVMENVITGMYWHRRSSFWQAVLNLPTERRERRICEERAQALLARVGVKTDPRRPAQTLSYGDQRRVELARALAAEPKMLLLDEPTAGMNAQESAMLGELFRDLQREGLTLLIVEHNIRLMLTYCEAAIVVNFGKLIAAGRPSECIENPAVREAYFGKQSDAERIESLLKLRRD